MSLPWIRVDVEFVDHPKVFQLEELTGDRHAGWYVVRLWSWMARYSPDGSLKTVLRPSLERSLGWSGKPGELLAALLQVGLLEEVGEMLVVHDWDEQQGAIAEKARKDRERAKERRNSLKTVLRPPTDGLAFVVRDETRRDVTKETTTSSSLDLVSVEPQRVKPPPALEDKLTDDEFQVFEHWRATRHPKAKATPERKRLIARALKNYSVADLQLAITGITKSPHHMGENGTRTVYDDIELILRDAKHIESFLRLAGGGR